MRQDQEEFQDKCKENRSIRLSFISLFIQQIFAGAQSSFLGPGEELLKMDQA